jgi:hypothetical protein
MRTPTAAVPPRAAAVAGTLLVALLVALLTACEGTTSALGPPLGGSELTATTGGTVTVGGQTSAALVGRWSRVDGVAPGVLVETSFTFLSGGSGARTVITRSALGAVLSEDRQPFTWSAGAGVLLIRFPGPVGETILRASFAVDAGLSGTTLRLDGISYRRAGV